jgi:hypothetical protein
VLASIEHAQGVGSLISPIKDMEDVSAGALPDLSAFLPLWVKRLEPQGVEGRVGERPGAVASRSCVPIARCQRPRATRTSEEAASNMPRVVRGAGRPTRLGARPPRVWRGREVGGAVPLARDSSRRSRTRG